MNTVEHRQRMHRHRPVRSENPRHFTRCVARPGRENKAAWHGQTYTEVCRCGWERDVNISGDETEWGPWRRPLP